MPLRFKRVTVLIPSTNIHHTSINNIRVYHIKSKGFIIILNSIQIIQYILFNKIIYKS